MRGKKTLSHPTLYDPDSSVISEAIAEARDMCVLTAGYCLVGFT
jgi:hypothetical protein